MSLLLFIVIKHPTRLCQIPKGFSVFFWITPSHEVSRYFPPPHTLTHQYTQTLGTFYIFTVHRLASGCTLSVVENLMSHGRRGTNPGSSVADCVHTAIFQNIHRNRAPYHANQIQGSVPYTSDLRSASTSTTKEIDK